MENFDVAVVGAGPSGSTAAYYMGNDLSTIVLDKHDFPRHKACGGGVLNTLDVRDNFENFSQVYDSLSLWRHPTLKAQFYRGSTPSFLKVGDKPIFEHIPRYNLDDMLLKESLKKPNVQFRKFNLDTISQESNGRYLLHQIEGEPISSQFVIGADGWNSVVSSYLGNKTPRNSERAACIEMDITCKVKDNETSHIFLLFDDLLGYSWVFPTSDGCYVGLGAVNRRTNQNLNCSQQIFLDYCINEGLISKDFSVRRKFGANIPVITRGTYATDNILLVGDAAGAAHQISGEGIVPGMITGKIAGETISQNTRNVAESYSKRVTPFLKDSQIIPIFPPAGISVPLLKATLFPLLGFHPVQNWIMNKFARRTELYPSSHYSKFK